MSTLVNEMNESTGKDVVVFHKFLLDNEKNSNTLFWFVEGKDFCYYNTRIRKNTSYEKYINYRCDGKKNVIGVRNLITRLYSKRKNTSLLFFVDRDYDFEIVPKDIYVTDFYSIENFYLNEITFKVILENVLELELNCFNYNKALDYYKKCYKIYSLFAVKLNAFYYTIRKYEKKYRYCRTNFNKIKFSYFIENKSIENFSMKNLSFDDLKLIYNIDYELEEIQFYKNMMLFDENDHYNFRGKSELDFLSWILSTIRIEIKNGNSGFKKQEVCKYDFSVDIMLILSEYAYTPDKLLNYICSYSYKKNKHKKNKQQKKTILS